MDAMRPGIHMAHGTWSQVIRDGLAFLDRWGDVAIAAGWDTLDVFGTNADPRQQRVDRLGLMVCLDGRKLQAISATRAVVDSGLGVSVFDRTLRSGGAIAVWNISKRFEP